MSVETKATLNDETIDKLQKIIRSNIDSYDGFQEAAKKIDDQQVSQLFRDLAKERSQFASELQQHVKWNGEEAEDDGSVAAWVHRVWIDIRSMLNGGDTTAILSEAERGEDQIKKAYENVLKDTAGSAMNDVLQRQYAKIKAGHDRVRDMRDAYKNQN